MKQRRRERRQWCSSESAAGSRQEASSRGWNNHLQHVASSHVLQVRREQEEASSILRP